MQFSRNSFKVHQKHDDILMLEIAIITIHIHCLAIIKRDNDRYNDIVSIRC